MNEGQVNITHEGKDKTLIVFSGDLILDNIAVMKKEIEAFCSIFSKKQLIIRIREVSALDLSFLQLLAVFCTRLEKLGVQYSMNWELEEELQLLLEQTGFEKYV